MTVKTHRIIQWIAIALILLAGAGWHYRTQVKGAMRVNVSQNNSLTNGLIGQWSFNGADVSGTTVYDRSGSGNNGTLTYGPTITPGKVGQALQLDGSDDHVDVPGFNQTVLPATMMAWIKTSALEACDGVIFSRGSSVSGINAGSCQNATKLGYHWNEAPNTYAWAGGPTIPTNEWVLVAIVVESDKATAYVDSASGGLVSAVNAVSHSATVIDSLKIGKDTYYGRVFNGQIDEVRVYNRALSATEITTLYQSGAAKVNTSQNNNLTSGLVGQWSFNGDDVSGTTAYDRSGSGNNGTLTNGPTITPGKAGQALQFDGTDDYVVSGGDVNISSNQSRTITGWFKQDSALRQNIVGFGSQDAGKCFDMVADGTTGTLWGHFYSGGMDTFGGAPSYSLGVWNHFAMTYDGTYVKVYLNGVFGNQGAFSLNTTNSPLIIGKGVYTAWTPFDGAIDEVRVYNRALSASEITALYRSGSVKMNTSQNNNLTSGLVGQWSFNGLDVSGTTAYDRSGSGNNGTLGNGPTITPGKVGQALNFDGVDDYVSVGTPHTSLDNLTTVTVSFWMKGRTFSGGGELIDIGNPGSGWYLGYVAGGQIFFTGLFTTQNVVGYTNTSLQPGVWSHVVATWDGTANSSGIRFYINGVDDGSLSSVQNGSGAHNDDSENGFYIGGCCSSKTDGAIDEVRVYNRILSASEVSSLYNMGR